MTRAHVERRHLRFFFLRDMYAFFFCQIYYGDLIAGKLLYVCPHTATYISCYMCVLILLHRCPHTATCVRILMYVLILLYTCPHTAACVLILLYTCPHTAVYVSSCCCMCPHTAVYVSSYCCMCPHTLCVHFTTSSTARSDGWGYLSTRRSVPCASTRNQNRYRLHS
jgi:hypothetical protein